MAKRFLIGLAWLGHVAFAGTPLRAETAVSIDYSFVDSPRFSSLAPVCGCAHAAAAAIRGDAAGRARRLGVSHSLRGKSERSATATDGRCPPVLALSAKGYGMLAINTRQHDERVTRTFPMSTRSSVYPSLQSQRLRGLVRHSSPKHCMADKCRLWGNAASKCFDRTFESALAGSAVRSAADEDAFSRQTDAALKAVRDGKEDQLLPLPMRRTGQPIAAQHFLTYRSEASSTADGTYWIKRIPRPILMVRDAGDTVIQPFELRSAPLRIGCSRRS